MSGSPELHLFLLWSEARREEARILDDLRTRFHVVQEIEVVWSADRFADNLTRFYGTSLPPGSFKEVQVGVGPMLAIVIEVADAVYETR
jgi:hypothetical protein